MENQSGSRLFSASRSTAVHQYVGAAVVGMVDAVEGRAGDHHSAGGVLGDGTEHIVDHAGLPFHMVEEQVGCR
nr:hypothetical protein [Actinocrispum wychmicini]